ncbi:citrate-binding protein-like [Phoenix dactylifera]|uniref:Citrate-binding protein-like n=1 Tax=Phoenix dactylifera TaxID=42345 RepID=A0A8B9AW68_PHODC|nr:citrate-binding protein-like [Phoenix dactylifera]
MAVEAWPPDPTYGFISLPLNNSNFDIQKPYDLPVSERYSFINGIHKLWVLSTDKPHSLMSHTAPRTEIRIQQKYYLHQYNTKPFQMELLYPRLANLIIFLIIFLSKGYDYSSGVWQFEGRACLCPKRNIRCVHHASFWSKSDGYNSNAESLQWCTHLVKVFIDGALKLVVNDRGGASHYFKYGVYAQNDSSYFMESQWKHIKVLKLPD